MLANDRMESFRGFLDPAQMGRIVRDNLNNHEGVFFTTQIGD